MVQTNVGEGKEFSKTIYAECSSQWLRGEDAGSPGAFLHSMLSIVLNNSREFFFHFVLEQSRTKELVKEHTPFRGCGWRSKGEAETDVL